MVAELGFKFSADPNEYFQSGRWRKKEGWGRRERKRKREDMSANCSASYFPTFLSRLKGAEAEKGEVASIIQEDSHSSQVDIPRSDRLL